MLSVFITPQFHDKIIPMLESLQRIAERLRQPPSISAECEKIREQISENKNVSVELEKLQPVYETLKMRGEEMIARSEGADKDISAKGNSLGKTAAILFIFSGWYIVQTLVLFISCAVSYVVHNSRIKCCYEICFWQEIWYYDLPYNALFMSH